MYAKIINSAPGMTAQLISDKYPPTPANGSCLQFFYHLYGNITGQINVKLQIGNTINPAPLFAKSTNQGNQWNLGMATITNSNSDYQLVFEAVTGSGTFGDFAIDDIQFKAGACPPIGSCNFESSCSWYNTAVGDNFDWIINSGGTPSIYTGPENDHTFGTPAGHYLYFEASNSGQAGETAWYVSEKFNPTGPVLRCLSFYYLMYGATVNTLSVILQEVDANNNNLSMTTLGVIRGNQGKQWKNGQVFIETDSAYYRIILQATMGRAFTGDIAVDDISFYAGNCTQNVISTYVPPTAAPGPTMFDCTFETDMCNWNQGSSSVSWARGSSRNNGTALKDHTLGTYSGRKNVVITCYLRMLLVNISLALLRNSVNKWCKKMLS